MDDFLSDKLGKATEKLSHDFESLLFLDSFAFDGFLEVTIFTEFGYDVEAVF